MASFAIEQASRIGVLFDTVHFQKAGFARGPPTATISVPLMWQTLARLTRCVKNNDHNFFVRYAIISEPPPRSRTYFTVDMESTL